MVLTQAYLPAVSDKSLSFTNLPYNYLIPAYVIRQVKFQELEMKLREEEHQRKLLQDKANQVCVPSPLLIV